MRGSWQIAALVLLGLAGMDRAMAQDTTCNPGDIAWVVSDVDADVGTGAGAGRCTTNTVAGAAYNDITMPWGVQAAFDCACAGVEIRVLGDTGNYGSATNSWNNRFDASQSVNLTIAGGSLRISVIGYAEETVACGDDNTGAGCPVEMDFTGQPSGGHGLRVQNTLYEIRGIHVEGADTDCIRLESSGNQVAGMEVSGCGGDGIEVTTSGSVVISRSYFHNLGDDVAADAAIRFSAGNNGDPKLVQFNTIRDVTAAGISYSAVAVQARHNILQDVGGDCIQIGGLIAVFDWNTLRDCGGDGFDLAPGAGTGASGLVARFNLITGAGGWAFNDLSQSTRWANVVGYNVMGGNSSGDIAPAAQPIMVEALNITGVTPAYVSATDSTPDGPWATITLFYPRGTTEVTINAGAIVESSDTGGGSGGGGGVFIPGGPR